MSGPLKTGAGEKQLSGSKFWLGLNIAGAFVLLIVAGVLCLGTFLTMVFVGGALSFDPNDYVHLQDWTRNIGLTARGVLTAFVLAGVYLGVTAIIAVVAAWRRNVIWGVGGAVSGALLFVTLVFSAALGFDQIVTSVDAAHDRIGRVELISPDLDPRAYPKYRPKVFSEEEVKAEIDRMILITAEHSSGSLVVVDPLSGEETEMDLLDPPLQLDSCYPNPEASIGNKLSIQFTVPSDANGEAVQLLAAAWSEAGYPTGDEVRDQYFMGSDRLAIGLASINESYTIDGKVRVSIESRCAMAQEASGGN